MVRVLKQYDPTAIACELINQLLGYEYLQDGKYVESTTRYPQRKVGIATHTITSTMMIVFTDRESANDDILREADRLLSLIPLDKRVTAPLCTDVHAHSWEQVQSSLIRTQLSESGVVSYTNSIPRSQSYRFVCVRLPLNEFDGELSTEFPVDSIAKYICGVYVDEWDTLACEAGVIWDFPPELFREHGRIVDNPYITICAGSQPLAVQQSSIPGIVHKYTSMRGQLNKPVREGKLEWFTLDAPTIGADSRNRSVQLCARCKDVMWGENYVLYDHKQPCAIAMHPICLHMSPADVAIEDDFTHVFRVQMPPFVPTDDISQQAMLGTIRKEVAYERSIMVYYLIGTKYVWFHHHIDSQYRGANLPDTRERKILRGLNIITV
jgi:hypothetical protein